MTKAAAVRLFYLHFMFMPFLLKLYKMLKLPETAPNPVVFKKHRNRKIDKNSIKTTTYVIFASKNLPPAFFLKLSNYIKYNKFI